MPAPLEPEVVEELAAIGIFHPDPTDELHVRLVDALRRTQGRARGDQLVALRWVFVWHLNECGDEYAIAKATYESHIASNRARLMVTENYSGVKAEAVAKASDEAQEMNMRFQLGLVRERLARKRLDTIDAQIEVWRSVNASERKADDFHARRS